MFDLDLSNLFAAKGGRPHSVIVALSAIFLPSSLLVYLTRPDLFERFGVVGGIFFGAAVGLPLLSACCWPWNALLVAGVKQDELNRRITEAQGVVQSRPEPGVIEKVTAEDPLEWPVLLAGGWTANLVLYSLVILAYYRPLLLGATLLLTVGIILAVGLICAVALNARIKHLERRTNEAIAKRRPIVGAVPPGGSPPVSS